MKNFKLYTILIVCLMVSYAINAQNYINKRWEQTSGLPDNLDWSSSTLDKLGNIIHVGNTVINSSNTNILITKLQPDGQKEWEREYDTNINGKDYGISVLADDFNNIYVSGIISTTSSEFDFCLLKYDEEGNLLWQTTWSGSTALDDIPTAMAFDNAGNIIVAGGMEVAGMQSDFFVLKYNSAGVLSWQYLYDYAGGYDFPTSIQVENNNNILVTGASATNLQTWDYTTIRLDATTGIKMTENRVNIPGVGLDKAVAIAQDDVGNIYLTGYTDASGNKNIQTVKLDHNLNLSWVKDFDANGLADVGEAIGIDNLGNVYVTGFAEHSNGGSDIVTIKYDASGQNIWVQSYSSEQIGYEAKPSDMTVTSSGDLFILGSVEDANGKDFVTIEYDKNGQVQFEKRYNSSPDDEGKNLTIGSNGEIYVSGVSTKNNISEYKTLKYELEERSNGIVYVNGVPSHSENELIIKFLPQHVNLGFVDNKELQFGTVDEALPTYVIQAIETEIENSLDEVTVFKPFYRMTSSEQFSTTRLGETVPISKFWSVFTFSFPNGYDIKSIRDKVNNNLSEYISYAEYDYVSFSNTVPDDGLYASEQPSLHSTTDFSNANINVEPAWDIETGQNYIKVGVYDSPIFWAHQDFGNGTFAGSNIVGGWSWGHNASIASTTPDIAHGTNVAGIIGALRNNNQGIAGIAGGGPDAQGSNNSGVQLFSMGIQFWNDLDGDGTINSTLTSNEEPFVNNSTIAAAIIEGAVWTPTFGYGLHVQNHSWGTFGASTVLRNAVKEAYRNQCIVVASRGNGQLGVNALQFPACFEDRHVINVGGSGINGEYFDGSNGELDENNDPILATGFSIGGDVDFIAPGVRELVTTTYDPNNTLDPPNFADPTSGNDLCGITDPNYSCFNGTSAATPHVAGVVALMCSRHHPNKGTGLNNALANEDVEEILQKTATDIINSNTNPPYPVGYDDNNGFGRINAGAALQMVNNPAWEVFHSGTPLSTQQTTSVMNNFIVLPAPIDNLAAGTYLVDQRVQVTDTYTDIFPVNIEIEDHWERQSSTIGYSAVNPVIDEMEANTSFSILAPNVITVTASTFAWHLTTNPAGQAIDVWIPDHPNNLRTAYSLHLRNTTISSTDKVDDDSVIAIFPNPARDYTTITHSIPSSQDATLIVYDITGKMIISQSLQTQQSQSIELNTTDWSSGVYLVRIRTDKEQYTKKLVKF